MTDLSVEAAGSVDQLPAKRLAFTRYAGTKSPRPQSQQSLEWEEAVRHLSLHLIRPVKEELTFSFVNLKERASRKNESVVCLSAVVLDIDNGTPVKDVLERLRGFEVLAVSSFSHSDERPRYRIILSLARDVSSHEWRVLWGAVNVMVGGCADPAAIDPSRIYYFPSCPPERQENKFVKRQLGQWLSPDNVPTPPTESAAKTKNVIIEKALLWNSNNLPPLPENQIEKT